MITVKEDTKWNKFFNNDLAVSNFEDQVLPSYIRQCRWFGGKARVVESVKIDMALPVNFNEQLSFFLILKVVYKQKTQEFYFLPVTFVEEYQMDKVDVTPVTILCDIEVADRRGAIIDACYHKDFRDQLFLNMSKSKKQETSEGQLIFESGTKIDLSTEKDQIKSRVLKAEQSNTSIIYNEEYFFKFYRKIEKEINPDLEITRFLSENTDFKNAPQYAGSIYMETGGSSLVFGLMQDMVPNQGEAWTATLDAVGAFYDKIIQQKDQPVREVPSQPTLSKDELPDNVRQLIGDSFLGQAAMLGERTAEMHMALASDKNDPAFAPEALNKNDLNSTYKTMESLVNDRFELLADKKSELNGNAHTLGEEILNKKSAVLNFLENIRTKDLNGMKTRIHGDYHLGQVLFTGDDFIIIDYEGEPGLSFKERRVKRSPFKDVAGMIRSFHYAAYGKIYLDENLKQNYKDLLEPWAEIWFQYIKKIYLGAYIKKRNIDLSEGNKVLLNVHTLEKAVYELGYELNSRPDWVTIPMKGIKLLVEEFKNKI